MAQVFEVREGLETVAARLAAAKVDPREVDELLRMFRGFSGKLTAALIRRYIERDRHFHWRLVELAGNPHLTAAMESVHMMIAAYQLGLPRTPAETIPEHCAILEALRKRDPDASEAAMRIHIRRSVERLWSRARAEESNR
jgi:DNA-binding GntR family transcriptional regulator